ncbi:outer membrane protein assembly factor BamB family protein [Halorubrum ezzemoulense]|uniref:outer membrane protein assembly factor BamB family protein n=1 Tax=Halorubrum ezzemoulense TaxID=337243 RepID=UPI00232DDB99|nr:PQQ-binding-like beta-propeller repeat protein [Halorubrum ezzemoulense]MDB2240671.1 PQQ-binding-like beta-propeller repeat protein [Halorubrum ezzemoulense]
MDRRVLFATLILLAGGATGVGVALFAFVGVDDATTETTIVWESGPAPGDDGSGAAVATVDGEPLLFRPAAEDGSRVVRATAVGIDETPWSVPVSGPDAERGGGDAGDTNGSDGDGPVGVSGLTAGTLAGDPVVALTTAPGELVVLDAADGTERFAVDLGGPSGVRPAIGDLTGDGSREVAAVTTDGGVRVVDAAGDSVAEASLAGEISRRPLIVEPDAEADERGGLAVLTTAGAPATVHMLDASGGTRWTTEPTVNPLSWNAADSRDGPVLALGGANGNIETLETSDGSDRYEVGLQDLPVAIGDADPGRVYVGGSGSVWAVDLLDGEVVWKQQYGASTRINEPRMGDVDGDGELAPVVVNRDGEALAMTQQGEVTARGGPAEVVAYGGPLFADVTGDGGDEVIVVADDGTAIAVDT